MAVGNRDSCIAVTINSYEGGYSDNPHDPGGPTKYGVTLAVARQYWKKDATAQDVKDMPIGVAVRIFATRYWDIARLDEVPAGPDFATFDYNVNSGVSRGVKALQKAVGVTQDGVVGAATLAAAAKADPVATVKAICAGRLSFLHGLSNWRYFGKGWGRRVADVESRSVKLALEARGTRDIAGELAKHGATAKKDATKAATKAGGTVAAPTATQAPGTVAHIDLTALPHWVLIAAGVVVVGVAFYFAWKAYQHKQRADAYAAVAKEA